MEGEKEEAWMGLGRVREQKDVRVLIHQKNQNESCKFCYYTPGFYFPTNLMKLRYIKLKSNTNFQVASMVYWIGYWADKQEVPGSRLTCGN